VKGENENVHKNFLPKIIETSNSWGNCDNMMYVAGATQASMLKEIRKIIPDHFLLVPGIGAQGGSLEEVAKYGMKQSLRTSCQCFTKYLVRIFR